MSESPLVVHVQRPYATVEEYLEAEAWTIETRSMLLIDAAELPVETAVLFDVSIKGEKLIRAEGRVVAFVTPEDGSPGGLRVKFRRYGASTKAFIDRAVTWQKDRAESPQPSAPEPSMPELVAPSIVTSAPVAAPHPSTPESTRLEAPASIPSRPPGVGASQPPANSQPPAKASAADAKPSQPPPASTKQAQAGIREPSGVHRRPLADSDVPPNRDELLARLRERARNLGRERFDDPESGTG